MTLDRTARVSGSLSLALAVACLAYAEVALLPDGLPEIMMGCGVVLAVLSFVAPGRGWVLSARAANRVALLAVLLMICGGTAAALLCPDWFGDLPVMLLVLPYAGPLLVVLALLKSFRLMAPNDRRVHQGLGLLMVGLACVLAEGGLFSVLLLAYLVCGTWHLSIAFLRHEELRAAASTPAPVPGRALGLMRGGRWVMASTLLALPIFLLAPRLGDEAWSPFFFGGARKRATTGLSNGIDLNQTGTLEPVDEVVIEVDAYRDSACTEPKTDLGSGQRWRGLTLDSYDNGRWQAALSLAANSMLMDNRLNLSGPAPQSLRSRKLPDLGPGQFYLDFTVQTHKADSLVLAEPAVRRNGVLPVIAQSGQGHSYPLFQDTLGSIVPVVQPRDCTEVHYRQVVPPAADPELSEPMTVPMPYAWMIRDQPVPDLEEWTRDQLRRLADQPGSPLNARDLDLVLLSGTFPGRSSPLTAKWMAPRNPERVARALSAYLASSGEYKYSFEQEREDLGLDPTFDFLRNVRHGPCTRFASGLALMLRSLGIPARVVLGYRGCENQGNGHYQILSSQAHAWVEALVALPGANGMMEWHWLMLDPTPSADHVPRPGFSLARWWEKQGAQTAALWRSFVIEYNADTQQGLVLAPLGDLFGGTGSVGKMASRIGLAAAIAAALIGARLGLLSLRRRRRRPTPRPAVSLPFYARLLDALAAHGLRPQQGQTPCEFAREAGRTLASEEATADLADIPARVVALAYRAAYGARPLTDAENREVERGLEAIGRKESSHASSDADVRG
jgi:transglutaminase-like putative cysteine protease